MFRREFLATIPTLFFLPRMRLESSQRLVWFVEGIYTAEGCDIPGLYQIAIDKVYGNRKKLGAEWKDKYETPGQKTLVCGFDRKPIKGERLRYSLIETWTSNQWLAAYKGIIL